MRFLKIKNIGEIVSGSTPSTQIEEYWNGNIAWVTPKEINRLKTPYLNSTERKLTEAGFKACSTSILPKGSILFTSRAPIGLVAIANIDVATNQGFKSIILHKGYYPLYIYYVLKYYSKRIEYLGTGSTFMELSKANFSEFQIPIPDTIEEQIRIASILSKTESTIIGRRETIELADELIRSTFLTMFGDPLLNDFNWKKSPLKKFGHILTGNTPPRNNRGNYSTNHIEWVKTDNIIEGRILVDKATEYLSETGLKAARQVNEGALLVTCIAGSIESIGRAALTDRKVAFNQQINAIQPNTNVLPNFLYWLFKINRLYVQSHSTNAMKRIIKKGTFEQILMILPPKSQQRKFSEVVDNVEILKKSFYGSLSELEDLYESLTQDIFNNKEILNNIPVDQTILSDLQNKNETIPNRLIKSKINLTTEPKINHISNKKIATKVNWDNVSTETIAKWLKNKFQGHHFNNEMMSRFLMDEHVVFLNYFSSEELKKFPPLNSKDDVKKFLFSALNGDTPFLKLKQHFINLTDDNILNLPPIDEIESSETVEHIHSGIYFSIDEQ
jgi:type I restriction enzyme S subunit